MNLESAKLADPLAFAREGGILQGNIPLERLGRLRDRLADTVGVVDWSVGGCEDGGSGRKRRLLRLAVKGELRLICQRCLGEVVFPLDVAACLELIPPGGNWPEDELEDDECDAIEAEHDLGLLALVEDEILLALPQWPRHESCPTPQEADGESGKRSPFAVLAALKH